MLMSRISQGGYRSNSDDTSFVPDEQALAALANVSGPYITAHVRAGERFQSTRKDLLNSLPCARTVSGISVPADPELPAEFTSVVAKPQSRTTGIENVQISAPASGDQSHLTVSKVMLFGFLPVVGVTPLID